MLSGQKNVLTTLNMVHFRKSGTPLIPRPAAQSPSPVRFAGRLDVRRVLVIVFAFALYLASNDASLAAQNATGIEPTPGLYNPIAAPGAVVRFGKARFTVLTPQMIRMEYASDGQFEDHASFVFLNRHLPVPEITTEIKHGALTLRTKQLTLTYHPSAKNGEVFSEQNLSISFGVTGKAVIWRPGKADSGNLGGTARTLDGVRGDQTTIEPGLLSRDGWTVVDDTKRPLFDSTDFRFNQGEASVWPWVTERPATGDRRDWYFLGYGHDYRGALRDYVRVAGRIPIPPKFAFGAWWSRYWAYSDHELENLADSFRANDVPLDVLVIDMDWHPTFRKGEGQSVIDQAGETKGWSGYSWNRLLFPDPEAFLSKLHQEGLKMTLNLHPASGVQPWEDAYPAMARAMGIDPATSKYVPFDITDKKFATNYMNLLHHPLEAQGVDFWWLDWQQKNTTKIAGVNPTFWLNYVHFTDQEREGKRPLLFHRWGGLGNHRYEIGFSGDTISVWDSLRFQPSFTATAANVGYAYWSHDIGGHMPGVVDPELYLRWLQFGALSPILRTHTTKNPDAERRIWAYPEPYSDAMREVFHLRYSMLPYIYTEARRTYDTGVAFVHPLYYDWPEEEAAYNSKQEYGFGDSMVVAPVTKPSDASSGLASVPVWLPPGEWFEWSTGRRLNGPASVQRQFDLRQIPIYVRAGSIIPFMPKVNSISAKPLDSIIIRVYPGVDSRGSTYTLYEDSSENRGYIEGEAAYTTIKAIEQASVLSVQIKATQGDYPGKPQGRAYELQFPGDWPPASVTVDGVAVPMATRDSDGWRYDGDTLTTTVPVGRKATDRTVEVEVTRSPELIARRHELDGFTGKIARLRAAYDALNTNFPFEGPSDELIDALQTGDRLTYRPESASAQIARFSQLLQSVTIEAKVNENGMTAAQRERYRASMGTRWDTEVIRNRIAAFDVNARRVAALLKDAGEASQ